MPRLATSLAGLVTASLGLSLLAAPAGSAPPLPASTAVAAALPSLSVSTVASGLSLPWDAKPLPDGSVLVTERSTKRLLRVSGGQTRPVAFPSASVWAAGETGLMSLEIDPGFSSNRRFYACHGGFNASTPSRRDVRVVAYRLSTDGARATRVRNLVTAMPARTGRHGGCRLLLTAAGDLLVGTGDAALGTNPRNLRSLGGKVLRVNRLTGGPVAGNPFLRSKYPRQRLVLTYGHRNVQGLAQRANGRLFSAEHGPERDDEVNLLVGGGDYGWHPVPGYNERVPMTDQRLRGTQRAAVWRSGVPTIATSGATFVQGSQWGDLNGTLAVAALKGERMVFMRFGSGNRLLGTTTPAALRAYGRLRSVTRMPDGDLLVTTANGSNDRVLRVSPGA